MHEIVLQEEQVRMLELLVEASRAQPRDDRQPFRALKDMTSHHERLILPPHPGLPADFPGFYPGDIEQLAREGLLNLSISPKGTWKFEVSPRGYQHYDTLKQQQGRGAERVEKLVRSYIDTTAFAQRHPAAWEKWRAAEEKLWAEDSVQADTTIGHLCREAHQEFADSLLSRRPVASAPNDKAKTKNRIRTILENLPKGSDAIAATTQSLSDYWSAVLDLAQRQEHAGLKEGSALTWEDSRRLVFHTLFAMTELDRIVERVDGR